MRERKYDVREKAMRKKEANKASTSLCMICVCGVRGVSTCTFVCSLSLVGTLVGGEAARDAGHAACGDATGGLALCYAMSYVSLEDGGRRRRSPRRGPRSKQRSVRLRGGQGRRRGWGFPVLEWGRRGSGSGPPSRPPRAPPPPFPGGFRRGGRPRGLQHPRHPRQRR